MLLSGESRRFGSETSNNVFVQLVDGHDMALMDGEIEAVRKRCGGTDWRVVAVPVSDWFQDLTPWAADPVFGNRRFGDGASRTLGALLEALKPGRRYCLCGYSLAGLFALWAGCRTDAFSGIVAASPSVWYPDWIAYSEAHPMRAPAVYLSLGDREERARNPVMASVGDAIRRQHDILRSAGIRTALEWNPGNHFVNSDARMARGIAWMLNATDGGNG